MTGGSNDLRSGIKEFPGRNQALSVQLGVDIIQKYDWFTIDLRKDLAASGTQQDADQFLLSGGGYPRNLDTRKGDLQLVEMRPYEDSSFLSFPFGF